MRWWLGEELSSVQRFQNPLMLEAPLNESGVEEPSDDTTATIIDTNATLTNGDQLRHGPPLITLVEAFLSFKSGASVKHMKQ